MDTIGKFFGPCLFFILAWYFYHDISDVPLAQLTLKQLGSNFPSLLLACIGVAGLIDADV